MALKAMGCVIQEFLSSIAALLCGAPCYTNAIFDRIANCAACARCMASCFSNVFGGSFHNCL